MLLAKIALIPLWRLQSSLRMRSITWPVHRGSPKTTRNNFLTPNVQSKSVPKVASFRQFKSLKIKYSHQDLQKALPYPEQRILTYLRGVGCSLIGEPKKRTKKLVTPEHNKITYLGSRNPKNRSLQNFACRDVITRANYCKDRLRGFSVARGRILAFSTELLRRL